MFKHLYLFTFTIFFLYSCGPTIPKEIKEEIALLPSELDYNIHVKPILSDKCFACHGPDQAKRKAGLRLDDEKMAFAELVKNKGKVAISPSNLQKSEAFYRIISKDPDYQMPTPSSHLLLSNYEKAVIIKWIDEGAKYKLHWAFDPPKKSALPVVKNVKWPKNAIDHFVLQKIEENKLAPSPIADKETLLRRVCLDLTGLPPSIAEINNFINDKAANAFEKVVDRLLATPHYGERMAVDWLDLARFADSHGYTVDRLRDMSPYRDWVIAAFNKNMPYNQFVKWQLAGDLMPNPTKEMMIATAFNRNHQQNLEGGIIEEEFQTEYVMDRTNTFGQAFLGLSVGCARCHDHKYDPISQKNYYEIFSFFNNVREAGQISWDNTMPSPTMLLPTKKQEEIVKFINKKIENEQENLNNEKPKIEAAFSDWILKKGYKNLIEKQEGLKAKFNFENKNLSNLINKNQVGFTTAFDGKIIEKFVNTTHGTSLMLGNDAWFDCAGIGAFRKADAFSIGLWVNIDIATKEGVIFHKTIGERLYNYKGFNLYLNKNGHLELTMAHAAPSNAITKRSFAIAQKGQWMHLFITYDGSGKAKGLKLFLNGNELSMETEVDQLVKDINYSFENGNKQTGLQVGGWWRGNGLKNGQIDDIVVYDRAITNFEIKVEAGLENWGKLIKKNANELSDKDLKILKEYFYSVKLRNSLFFDSINKLKIELADSVQKIQELMVMQEMPKPKQAYILNRGNYDSPTTKVYPNTPEKILAFPNNLPKNRLGLAEWLINKENPMTARVIVNRLWQQIFGVGIVKTSEDFGNQGELPANLPLLDYLAIDFQENNWDIKRLLKLMVMSASYQQSSKASKELLQKDPENRLMARGASARLTAEMMRDNALFAAGILKNEIGGKSIKPYQPVGLWEINNTTYIPDSTEIVYKRSLYIVTKRSVLNPTLAIFDGASRSSCEVRRQKTNTPLQALVTQNDPTYLEASKVLGQQMATIADQKLAIITTYQKLTGKQPNAAEIAILLELYKKELAKFYNNTQKTKGIINAGFYKINTAIDPVKVAANAVVANVILNSDACLTKR